MSIYNRLIKGRTQTKSLISHIPFQTNQDNFWQSLIQNDIISRIAGKPKPSFTITVEDGLRLLHARINIMGFSHEYTEIPYEWVVPRYYEVECLYHKGVLRYLKFHCYLDKSRDGHMILEVAYTVRIPFFGDLFAKIVHAHYSKALKTMAQKINKINYYGFETFIKSNSETQALSKNLNEKWQGILPHSPIPALLAEFVYAAPDSVVGRMRPFVVAKHYQLDRMEVLHFFFLATQAGYFDMTWDVSCPSCLNPNHRYKTLGDLETGSYCPGCSLEYELDFDRRVELTFCPKPHVRAVEQGSYCLGSVGNTPHIMFQFNLPPLKEETKNIILKPGCYRIIPLLGKSKPVFIDVMESCPTKNFELVIKDHLLIPSAERVSCDFTLHFINRDPIWQTIKCEYLEEESDAATAHLVAATQDYRDLFGSDSLRPGVKLGISDATLLFTDLKGSTAIYEAQGDSQAFGLVYEHFELLTDIVKKNHGAIVKTIGDAVMAVFHDPSHGMKTALAILHEFNRWNQNRPEALHIKLGMHQGPCIALNLNDKLDYFGAVVNKAARLQNASEGDDLVVAESFFQMPNIQEVIQQNVDPLDISSFKSFLKGFSSEVSMIRIIPKK